MENILIFHIRLLFNYSPQSFGSSLFKTPTCSTHHLLLSCYNAKSNLLVQ